MTTTPTINHDRYATALATVATQATNVDANRVDPRTAMHEILRSGIFEPTLTPLANGTPAVDIQDSTQVLADLAYECMTTAFTTWAHRMVLEFFARGQRSPLAEEIFTELRCGHRTGVTAMAAGMKALAGLEPLPIQGRRNSDGSITASGRIAWASNLIPESVIVLPVEIHDKNTPNRAPEQVVAFLHYETSGLTVRHISGLLALEATASGMLLLEDVHIPTTQVLCADFASFAKAFRPSFLLHQSALALGLAHRSLTEASANTGHSPTHPLQRTVENLHSHLETLTSDWKHMAATPERITPIDLLQLRLDAALTAANAAHAESATAGGAGYIATSGPARRLREASFFPVQSPSEGQLRWEISSLISSMSS
ncbi:sulfur acquisition oxidoreductase, SfnB family [Dermatophilus congolensis]|uniref:Sulfur acquisition oxidoreductase, SfnB family n=1 Tax=Dermatophilus congolensis TaxID=1863 RepID=A0AA46BPU6_9MICO|nr:acyl-CoA/acyl-ACP dehydrogenase [Dermatophilus congolensis]STD13841.1 sulfur acquisition oxidoreductase, SfnB family [Dermatophilus congolensis]